MEKQLEKKTLGGGEVLRLISYGDYYQVILDVNGKKVPLLNNPKDYDPVGVENNYDKIKTLGDFWVCKDDSKLEEISGSDSDTSDSNDLDSDNF